MKQDDLFDDFRLEENTPIASKTDIRRFLTAIMVDKKAVVNYRIKASELLIKLLEPDNNKDKEVLIELSDEELDRVISGGGKSRKG
jgi:hypothetical protein